jgi:predicted nucleic acid-binding protein
MVPRPNPGVVSWLADADEDRVFISVVTIAELRHGIERLAPGRRRKRLNEWIEGELLFRFEGRIINDSISLSSSSGPAM